MDRARGDALARSAGAVRQVVDGVEALPALRAEGRFRTDFQDFIKRRGLRIRDHRRHHRPCPPARRRRKAETQNRAIGRSRGGLTTKIVALVDAPGNLARFVLPPGRRHDGIGVEPLITAIDFQAPIGDKAFDDDRLRAEPNERGASAAIPPRANRVEPIACDFAMDCRRHPIENFYCQIKEFRRTVAHYDKTDESHPGAVYLVGAYPALKRMSTDPRVISLFHTKSVAINSCTGSPYSLSAHRQARPPG